jgi:hypothetical protein
VRRFRGGEGAEEAVDEWRRSLNGSEGEVEGRGEPGRRQAVREAGGRRGEGEERAAARG